MRAKTAKRLAILIVVFGLVGGGGYLLWRFQVGKMAQGVIARAAEAEEKHDFLTAEKLYREHLAVVREDPAVLIKYADAIIKVEKTPKRQDEALRIYDEILRHTPGNEDVRLKAAELAVEMGGSYFPIARRHLSNLLRSRKDDGKLEFLMGRCYEQEQDAANAVKSYQAAIEHGAPQRLEACQRRADLLRDPLGQPEQADHVIEAMVQSDSENYRVYLERGRYRRRFGLPGAMDDFQKALQQVSLEPAIYLEMAKAAESESGLDAARRILNAGLALRLFVGTQVGSGLDAARRGLDDSLKTAPDWPELYLALAGLDRAGRVDRAIAILDDGLKAMPDQVELRIRLAILLAESKETGKLLLQIEELRRIGVNQTAISFLYACYYINNNEFSRAREILTPLQTDVAQNPELKAQVNVLLAQCYGQLNEPEQQQDAYRRAISANPRDLQAQTGLIAGMIGRGEIDQAIKAYRRLMDQAPENVRIPLTRLLIARNQQRPESQRDWSEVERLIADGVKAAPKSVEPVILQAQMLLERGQLAKAMEVLRAARLQFPTSVGPWTVEAELLGRQGQFTEAMSLLDQAQRQFGDRVELRLRRAGLWVTKGGPEVVTALNELAQNLEPFSRQDRRVLLTALATELNRQQDLPGATGLWSRLAELEPDVLDPRLQLVELALQVGDQQAIEKNIQAIEKIDGLLGRYCRARYLIWQAQHTDDANTKQTHQTAARALLNELKSRRPDWSLIPLALAQLEEQELAQSGLDGARKREKQETLITFYLRAIDLGYRNLAVVRRAVQLLIATGRSDEVLQLYNRIPVSTQLAASDLGRQVAQIAVERRDYQQAEAIARKAVAARPGDFEERMWLVRILLDSGRQADAVDELRKSIDSSKGDSKVDIRSQPWLALVEVLILTKQPEKAEQAVRDAEASLSDAPLALARCCQFMGRAYEGGNADDQVKVKKWYGEARQWYAKAQAAQPKGSDDLLIERRLTEFFLQTKQVAEAEKQLSALLRPGASARSAGTVAWARRSLALTYIAGADNQKIRQALALFEPEGRQGGAIEDRDDLRVLARVHAAAADAQRAPEHRKRAIEILESLIGRNIATSEDRLLLARLEEVAGDWPKAREHYRELILRTDNPRDMESINRRPVYLAQFAEGLLQNHRPGEDQDLAEVQELIGKLKQIQPDLLATLILEVELDQARNRIDDATALIRSLADRPKLSPVVRPTLAKLAEKIGQFDLAEQLYRPLATGVADVQNQLLLAQFLGRRGHTEKALDICELLWSNPHNREVATKLAIEVLFQSNSSDPDPVQLSRVVRWLEQALEQNPQSTTLLVGLANLYEHQGNYQKAEEQYRRAIKQNDPQGIASNNLAWLMALRNGKLSEALDLINNAIKIKGPISDFLDTRGMVYVYLSAGEGQRAIDDLETAVAADTSASKYFHLAQAYLKVNDKEKARKSLEAAKTKGLPIGLHRLELPAYHKVISKLKTSSTGPPAHAPGSDGLGSVASRITALRY